jgi:hypothetical protein
MAALGRRSAGEQDRGYRLVVHLGETLGREAVPNFWSKFRLADQFLVEIPAR